MNMPAVEHFKALSAFWERIDRTEDCWEWTGGRYPTGYGRLYVRGAGTAYAHRLAYELTHGPIPKGLVVRHACDNPPCCRPDHLLLGTQADNVRDREERGRHPHIVKSGFFRKTPAPWGEECHAARLTRGEVAEIRRLYFDGLATTRWLARTYGISKGTLHKIIHYLSWRAERIAIGEAVR